MSETPHDTLFRFAFTQPDIAADHFRAALPPVVAAAARWDTMHLVSGSFVDEALKQAHSDVLYRVELDSGPDLWLYVLFEHQSTVDPLMAWRLLRYMARIWERALVERGGTELPYLVPMVLYKGERRWTVSDRFEALFPHGNAELTEALLPYVPRFRYLLQDLSSIPDDALRGVALREVVLLALKHAKGGTLWRLHAWEAVWRYVLTVAPGPPPEKIRGYLAVRLSTEGQRLIMGYGEQLLEEGARTGEARLLLVLMRQRYGDLPDEVVARVTTASSDQIEAWGKRILEAETLDQLLAG